MTQSMEEPQDKSAIDLTQIEAINNLGTARMALRWTLERIRTLKRDLAEIDWSKPVAEVYNISRAANPAPGAWTTLSGVQVQVYDSAKLEGEGAPGTVVEVSEQGVTVQAKGGRRRLTAASKSSERS